MAPKRFEKSQNQKKNFVGGKISCKAMLPLYLV